MKNLLFAIPYAGGSSLMYNDLANALDIGEAFIPIDLPGKGFNFGDEPIKKYSEAVDYIFDILQDKTDNFTTSYSILGYSMGSILAYEVIKKIVTNGYNEPEYVFFCAMEPPHLFEYESQEELSDYEFIKSLVEDGGIPHQVLDEFEDFKIFVPSIRADYTILDDYHKNRDLTPHKLGSTKVIVISSNAEENSTEELWQNYSNLPIVFKRIDDGHFFIHERYAELANLMQAFHSIKNFKNVEKI
jgi:surfactin synthase thioesterase subunit